MGNSVEYGIRINVSGNQAAVNAFDQVTTSTDNLTTTVEKTGKSLAAVNGQMNDTAAIMRQNAEATNLASEAARKFLEPLQREIDLFGASRGEVERYKAAKAGLSNVVQQQAAALGASIDAMHRDEEAARQVAAEQDRAAKSAEQFLNKLKDQVATLGMNTAQLQAHRAAQLGVTDAAAPLIQRLAEAGNGANTAGKHMEGLNFQTVGARRELLVLAHELSQGNFKNFGGSLMVLGEQTGAAGVLFSTAGLAVLGFGAALVGVAAAVIKGGEEQRAMNNALIKTGNYAGLTSDSLNALAHAATESGGSLGEAKKAVTELAGSGKFTGEQIGYITEAAVEMEHASGKSIEKTIAEFQSLAVEASGNSMRTAEAISKATIKLDEQYHFLTESVYEQIRALEKEGDQKGASALATETLAKVTKERAEEMKANIGGIQHAWQVVKEVVGGVVDNLENMGKRATPASEVAKFRAQLVEFDKEVAESNARLGRPQDSMGDGLAAARLKIVMNLTGAVDALNKVDAKALEQSKARATQSAAVLAASRIEQDNMRLGKKTTTELDDAIQKYGEDLAKIAAANPTSKLLGQDAVNEHMALLMKAHTAKAKAPTGQDDRAAVLQDALTNEQAGLEREKSIYDAREKMLELYHSKLGLSDADFYAGRQAARVEFIASEAIAFAKEAALVKSAQAQARNPQEVAAAKEKYDQLVKAHQKFVDDMRNAAGQDVANGVAANQKSYQDTTKAVVDAGAAVSKSLDDQIAKQKLHNAEIGKTKAQIELEKQAAEDRQTAQLQSDAEYLRDGLAKWQLDEQSLAIYKIRLANLDTEIAKRKEISGLLADGAGAEEGAKAAQDLAKFLDPTKAQAFGQSMKGAFGAAIDTLGKLTHALTAYGAEQAKIQKAYADAEKERKGGAVSEAKYLDDISKLNERNTQVQLAGYGNMASAAAGFFDEHSRGYKSLMAVSQVFHAAELAMTTAELLPKAISAVLTQGQGDPYTAFGRMAAMAALVTGLGVALSGGGGGQDIAKQRQTTQGAGTVLGDSNAKSDSLNKAIEATAANSSTQIDYLSGLLTTLRTIQSDINSFAGQLVQSTNITAPQISLKAGAGSSGLAKADLTATGAELGSYLGPIGTAAGAALGYLASKIPAIQHVYTSIFGGKQTLDDSGLTIQSSALGSLLANGAHGMSYADITTSGGWFRKGKQNEQTTSLGNDADRQFTTIIASLTDSVKQASSLLGVSGDDFANKLNSFVVDIGKISLKGLSGEEVQKQLEAVFSKLGDQMAQYALGGLEPFEKVGEGYLDTLVRVASDYAKVDASLQSIGKTFGSVGIASIAARENLISLMGGVESFQSKTADFGQNFLTKAQQLAPVTTYVSQQLQSMNLGWVQTREQFAGVIQGLDLTSTAGQQTYSALMNMEGAFAATHAAIVDTTKSAQDIVDERKDLQSQLDELTMTSTQLLAKQRAALDESNRALFDQVQGLKAAKDEATGLLGDVDSAYSVLQKVVEREKTATQTVIDAHTAAVSKLQSLSESLHSTLNSMQSPEQQVLARTSAQAQIRAVLASAKAGGELPEADTLKDALGAVAKDASAQFGSYTDYLRDLYQTQNDIAQLGDVTDDSLSVEQEQLKAAQEHLKSLDSILTNAQEQIDVLKGQSTTLLSIDQAVAEVATAIAAAKANPIVSSTQAISNQYQQSLGRAPDAAGLAYWQQQASAGVSVGDITQAIATSAEATIQGMYQTMIGHAADAAGMQFWLQQLKSGTSLSDIGNAIAGSAEAQGHKIPGFASGGDFAGGWRIVGENGPELEATGPARIFNANRTSDLLSRLTSPSNNNDALLAEIRELRKTVTTQQKTLDRIAQSTGRHADMFENATAGGGPLLVEIA